MGVALPPPPRRRPAPDVLRAPPRRRGRSVRCRDASPPGRGSQVVDRRFNAADTPAPMASKIRPADENGGHAPSPSRPRRLPRSRPPGRRLLGRRRRPAGPAHDQRQLDHADADHHRGARDHGGGQDGLQRPVPGGQGPAGQGGPAGAAGGHGHPAGGAHPVPGRAGGEGAGDPRRPGRPDPGPGHLRQGHRRRGAGAAGPGLLARRPLPVPPLHRPVGRPPGLRAHHARPAGRRGLRAVGAPDGRAVRQPQRRPARLRPTDGSTCLRGRRGRRRPRGHGHRWRLLGKILRIDPRRAGAAVQVPSDTRSSAARAPPRSGTTAAHPWRSRRRRQRRPVDRDVGQTPTRSRLRAGRVGRPKLRLEPPRGRTPQRRRAASGAVDP